MRSLFRLFDRRPASSPRLERTAPIEAAEPEPALPLADLRVASAPRNSANTGLLVGEVSVRANDPRPATLRVFAEGAPEPALEKAVALTTELQPLWFAVHSHLLPNGPANLRIELVDAAGRRLAEAPLTLDVRHDGPEAEAIRASLLRSGAPLAIDVCDSSLYDYADDSLAAWHDRGPEAVEDHLAALAAAGAATPQEIALLRHFVEEGYLVMPDAIDPAHMARLNAALDDAVAQKIEGYEWGQSERMHDLHRLYPAIQDLWVHPAVMRMLSLIFDARPRPCQSLTYVFGSEQHHHQDTIVLTSFPAGRMCGVWTALEDVQPESGELMIYPRSHRLPRVYLKDAGIPKITNDWTRFGETVATIWDDLLGDKFRRELYRPKAGTVLIWHENLMHAGRVRRNREQSRRSIVGHYFSDGCICYSDASGMPGPLYDPGAIESLVGSASASTDRSTLA